MKRWLLSVRLVGNGQNAVKTRNFATMKRLRAIFGMMLLVLLFGITSGFNLFTHLCLMTGESGVAPVSMSMDCCGNQLPDAPVTLSMNCCIEKSQFIKFEYSGSVQNQVGYTDYADLDYPVIQIQDEIQADVVNLNSFNLPPPFPGDIRVMQCIYRIWCAMKNGEPAKGAGNFSFQSITYDINK